MTISTPNIKKLKFNTNYSHHTDQVYNIRLSINNLEVILTELNLQYDDAANKVIDLPPDDPQYEFNIVRKSLLTKLIVSIDDQVGTYIRT